MYSLCPSFEGTLFRGCLARFARGRWSNLAGTWGARGALGWTRTRPGPTRSCNFSSSQTRQATSWAGELSPRSRGLINSTPRQVEAQQLPVTERSLNARSLLLLLFVYFLVSVSVRPPVIQSVRKSVGCSLGPSAPYSAVSQFFNHSICLLVC